MVDAQSKLREVTRMFADFQHRKKKSCSVSRSIDNTRTEDAYESDRGQVPVKPSPNIKKRKSNCSWSANKSSSKSKSLNDKGSTGKENKVVKSKRKNRSVSFKPLITRSTSMDVTKSEDVVNAAEANSPIPKTKRRLSLRNVTRVSETTKTDVMKTDVTKTEDTTYEPDVTRTTEEKENLPPQNKYGKDCIEQREYDAMEKESFEVVQNARPATTQFRSKELRLFLLKVFSC
ncbi:hypothetical protein GCK32_008457 [Trichostrongylus colubriformis]|uniref:Uncharacterized protein n=1 Tax=Trichostrongylus colubriformis TaxID=6319 RepID=A0AAN8FKZ5_TRICO